MTTNTNAALRNALIEAQAGLEFAAARLPQTTDFVPSHIAALKIVNAALTTAAGVPPGLKDHEVALLVNRLRDIAMNFHDTQQLRERIAAEIRPVAHALAAAPKAEPVLAVEQPLPLLVRDIANDLSTTSIQVCKALADLGFGGHSVNMVVTPQMARSLRAHFATTQAPHSQFANGEQAGRETPEALGKPDAVAGPSEFPHEQMDAIALARYKVVPSNASMFWSHAVAAGDGTQQLYVGREAECQNMARKFAGAFLDGAFEFHSIAAAHTTHPAAPVALGDARLWCVNVQGPDDVHAAASKDDALEHANELNKFFARQEHHEYDPIMRAVVIEWPHSPDAHAADLRVNAIAAAARSQAKEGA